MHTNAFIHLVYSRDKNAQRAEDNQTALFFGQCTVCLVTTINLLLMVLVFMWI